MTTETLDLLMQRILIELQLASTVTSSMGFTRTASPERTRHQHPDSKRPPGPQRTDAEHFDRRYRHARTDLQRRIIIREALDELRSIRYGRHAKSDSTLEARLEIGRDTRPASIVAYVYGYSRQHIYRLRAAAREADELRSVPRV